MSEVVDVGKVGEQCSFKSINFLFTLPNITCLQMVESAKDGSMRKLYNAAMEGGNDYAIPPGG